MQWVAMYWVLSIQCNGPGLQKNILDRPREVNRIQTGGEGSVAAIVAVAEEARRVTGATATMDTLETVTPENTISTAQSMGASLVYYRIGHVCLDLFS